MAKRLLFIDIAKGLAILGVILVHGLIHGVWFFPSYALEVLPLPVLAILSPLVIVATWAGFFEMMSGLSNMYNIHDRVVVRHQSFKQAAQGPLVNSTGLLVAHFLYVIFFSHRRNAPYPRAGTEEINTMISGSLETGTLNFTDFQFFFFADVLGSIALAGYLSIFLIWVLYKVDGLQNPSRAWKYFLTAAVLFFVVSYPIWDWGYNLTQDLLVDGSPGALALALPLSMLTGAFQPFFPIAGFGIIGVILGMLLGVKNHKEEDPNYYTDKPVITIYTFIKWVAPASFLIFIGLLVQYIAAGNPPLGILEYYRLPPTLLALNTALMLWAIRLAMHWFEDHDEETRSRISQKTLFIRRFGMVTLSVYMFESVVNGAFSYVFHRLFDDPATPEFESHVAVVPIFMYVILLFALWFALIRLWEKASFAYGIEYWIIKIGSRFRSTKSQKLDLAKVLYNQAGQKKPTPVAIPVQDAPPEDSI